MPYKLKSNLKINQLNDALAGLIGVVSDDTKSWLDIAAPGLAVALEYTPALPTLPLPIQPR